MNLQTFPAGSFLERCDTELAADFFTILTHIPTRFAKDGPWLAGGAVRRVVIRQGFEGGDFDVFFKDLVQELEFKEALVDNGFKCIASATHASKYVKTIKLRGERFELVVQPVSIEYFKDLESVLDSFDYTACQTAYDGELVYFGEFALLDNGKKRLAVHKIKYPVSALRRLLKYTNHGYYACNGCLQAVADSIRALSENDFLNNKITYVD